MEVAAWEIVHFGSRHLEKYSWENATRENNLGKLPLRKIPMGVYLTYNIQVDGGGRRKSSGGKSSSIKSHIISRLMGEDEERALDGNHPL